MGCRLWGRTESDTTEVTSLRSGLGTGCDDLSFLNVDL